MAMEEAIMKEEDMEEEAAVGAADQGTDLEDAARRRLAKGSLLQALPWLLSSQAPLRMHTA